MRLVLITCVALASCSRQLTQVTDRKVEPAFLGELSGLYELNLLVPDDTRGHVEVPFGSRLQALHLNGVVDGEDLLLGIEERPYFQDPADVDDAETYQRLFFDAVLYANHTFEGGSNKGPVEGKRVAGGGTVTLTEMVRVCPSGPRYTLVADRVCPVNPALSGVYVGLANACAGGASLEDKLLALAFIDEAFLGHPINSETLVEGVYDRVMESGDGFSYGTEWETGTVTGTELLFSMREAAGLLHLSGDIHTFTCVPEGDCAGSCETLELERLAGGPNTECNANDIEPALASIWWERVPDLDGASGANRVLVVHSELEQVPGANLWARGWLRRAGEPGSEVQGVTPSACTEDCFCDRDCPPCRCDEDQTCTAACPCDPDCGCPCALGSPGECTLDCFCDPDCTATVCSCDQGSGCTEGCFCDLECFEGVCPCESPAGYTVAFPLDDPPSPVEYELFVSLFDPFLGTEVPAPVSCVFDDGDIDRPFDPSGG